MISTTQSTTSSVPTRIRKLFALAILASTWILLGGSLRSITFETISSSTSESSFIEPLLQSEQHQQQHQQQHHHQQQQQQHNQEDNVNIARQQQSLLEMSRIDPILSQGQAPQQQQQPEDEHLHQLQQQQQPQQQQQQQHEQHLSSPYKQPQVQSSSEFHSPNSPTPPCWRHCPRRRKHRIRSTYISPRGIGDRAFAIRTLSELAGYLCAIVEFPPPIVMLHPRHNGQKRVSPHVTWEDFYHFAFLQDANQTTNFPSSSTTITTSSSTIQQVTNTTSSIMSKDAVSITNDTTTTPVVVELRKKTKSSGNNSPIDIQTGNNSGWVHIVTKHHQTIVQDFQRVEAMSWELGDMGNTNTTNSTMDGFVWEIQCNWYKAKRMLQESFFQNQTIVYQPAVVSSSSPLASSNNNSTSSSITTTLKWNPQMLPNVGGMPNDLGCSYTKVETPWFMQRVVERVWDAVWNRTTTFPRPRPPPPPAASVTSTTPNSITSNKELFLLGGLQIRRGDAKEECDTSLERMNSFFQCTFQGIPIEKQQQQQQQQSFHSSIVSNDTSMQIPPQQEKNTTIMILFSSDERDRTYRKALEDMATNNNSNSNNSSYGPNHLIFLDLDHIIWNVLKQMVLTNEENFSVTTVTNNHYYAYRVSQVIRESPMLNFTISLRFQHDCPDCVNLSSLWSTVPKHEQ